MNIIEKFKKLGIDNAPGQEGRQEIGDFDTNCEEIPGTLVDFSHGDVDAFLPIPGTLESFIEGVKVGGKQAYTEYRGKNSIREYLANKISEFTGTNINFDKEIILTTGTQGALFLAMGANIMPDNKVAIVEPDYFANRKLVTFFGGKLVPIQMEYTKYIDRAGIDLIQLEEAFKSGVKLFVFSNPNNPTGVIYSHNEISSIAKLANKYEVTVIADELYSRQIFDERKYIHLCGQDVLPDNLITIIGPSKTESLSGYRLGVAFGTSAVIERMEKLQAIMSLRCSGYNQAVLMNWFNEPSGWMEERIEQHQSIRDDLLAMLRKVKGVEARTTEGGSYLFVKLPEMKISMHDFVKVLRTKANVIVTPGTEFGPQFVDWFRINFSQNHNAAIEAIDRTIKMMEWFRK
jgi:aspartate/methionine/tyrosine aminotransferase